MSRLEQKDFACKTRRVPKACFCGGLYSLESQATSHVFPAPDPLYYRLDLRPSFVTSPRAFDTSLCPPDTYPCNLLLLCATGSIARSSTDVAFEELPGGRLTRCPGVLRSIKV